MPLESKVKNQKVGKSVKAPVVAPADPIYTDEAAAAVLNCNLRILQEKFREGEIKGYKKLGKWYTTHSNLLNFLTS